MRVGGWGRGVLLGWTLALLSACGGGGGGEAASDPAKAVQLVNVRTAQATQRVYEGDRLNDITITADVTGDLSRLNGQTLFVLIEDASRLFAGTPRVMIAGNGINNRVELLAGDTSGRAGTYRTPLRLHVCLDSACSRPIQGSPVDLPLQIDVLAPLRLSPSGPLVITMPFGATPTPSSLAVLLAEGMSGFTLEDLYWGSPYAVRLTPGIDRSVDVTPGRLPVGTYNGSISVSGEVSLNGVQRLMRASTPVEIRVLSVPGLTASLYPSRLAQRTRWGATWHAEVSGETVAELTLADGSRQVQVSRIVYLPPDPANGTADAGGLSWLKVAFGTGLPAPNPVRVFATSSACVSPDDWRTYSCLARGRYEAQIFFRTTDGQELPTPLLVSQQVTD